MSTARNTDATPPSSDGYTRMPRWVRWFLAVAVVAGLLVILKLLVGGEHGPNRHMSVPVGADAVAAASR